MIDHTDAALVARIRRGERDAAERLAERYLRAARASALSVIGNVHAAEDVSQDAFIYAMEHIDECRHPERFGGWLRKIVRSRALNHLRDGQTRDGANMDWEPPVPMPSPAGEAERSELRDRILTALAVLREDWREVVLLHDLEGWTHQEIARQMELPPGTVRSHLHHAREQLRPLLATLHDQEE